MKPGERWLVRDPQKRSPYRLFLNKPELIQTLWPSGEPTEDWMDCSYPGNGTWITQRELPRNLRLKPGEGPVLVRIKIERVENEPA